MLAVWLHSLHTSSPWSFFPGAEDNFKIRRSDSHSRDSLNVRDFSRREMDIKPLEDAGDVQEKFISRQHLTRT